MKEVLEKFELTAKQELFCREFLKDLNTYAALIRSGYAPNFAKTKGYQYLRKEKIMNYLEHLRKEQTKRIQINADDVLRRILRIANAAEDNQEFNSALRALELLGRHLALFTDRIESDVKINPFAAGGSPEDVAKATERLLKVAAPKLLVLHGGKPEETDEKNPASA